MRALQSLIILFLCAGFVFTQQHRVGTSGPEPPSLQGQGRWHYRASLPHARSEVTVAEVSSKVYVVGGYADGFVDQPLNEEYDPTTNSWKMLKPMPTTRSGMAVAVLDGKIFGFDDVALVMSHSGNRSMESFKIYLH